MRNAENPIDNNFLINRSRIAANIKKILQQNPYGDTVRIPENEHHPTFPLPKRAIYAIRYGVWKDLIELGLGKDAAYNVIGINPKTAGKELVPLSKNP